MKGDREVDPYWFKMPHIGYWLVILPMLGYAEVLYFAPEMVPFDWLGPLGALGSFMVNELPGLNQVIMVAANIAHVGEGVWAYFLCRRLELSTWTTLKWYLQTTLIGFSSLNILRARVKKLEKSS